MMRILVRGLVAGLAGAGLALGLALPVAAVTIDWVTVGDPGNACDVQSQGCFGAVADVYRISATEVTNAQYAEFLNAVAATDNGSTTRTWMRVLSAASRAAAARGASATARSPAARPCR